MVLDRRKGHDVVSSWPSKAASELAAFTGPTDDDIVALSAVKDQAIADEQLAEGTLLVTKSEMAALTKEHEAAVALWTMAQQGVASTRAVIAECREEIKALAFNNALVKKLRAIRPIIANKLWNTVLASVSVMFSQHRAPNGHAQYVQGAPR